MKTHPPVHPDGRMPASSATSRRAFLKASAALVPAVAWPRLAAGGRFDRAGWNTFEQPPQVD